MRILCTRLWHNRVALRNEGGFSLIESIIAVAIIGSTVMALITAIFAVLVSTTSHKRIVFSGVELTTIAEAVRAISYVPCESETAMEARLAANAAAMLPGYSMDVVGVTYVDSRTNPAPAFYSRTDCLNNQDKGLQRVALKVTGVGGPTISEDLVVMKRDDRCPAALPVTPGRRC